MAQELDDFDLAALGINCGKSLENNLSCLQELTSVNDKPLCSNPMPAANSGYMGNAFIPSPRQRWELRHLPGSKRERLSSADAVGPAQNIGSYCSKRTPLVARDGQKATLSSFRFGNIEVNGTLVAAPMDGISDSAFRVSCANRAPPCAIPNSSMLRCAKRFHPFQRKVASIKREEHP